MEALQRLHNRGSISTGYDVDNSLKVEADNNEYLERSTSGASDGSSTQHTISVWVKRTELGVDCEPISAGGIGRFRFESDDTFSYQFRSGKELITTQRFRDTAAWYHIVAAADSSQATDSNRMKVYVNGVQVTAFGTANYQDQNQASPAWGKNTTYSLRVGAADSSTRNFSGYIAEAYYIDGQTLDPTYFGEFDSDTGIWKPKKFSGTYGSLDTYLDFSDSSNLGNNASGGTDLTATNITAADQATDTPTNNFMTLNPLDNNWANVPIINEGATNHHSDSANFEGSSGTIAMSSGKWYWEIKTMYSNGNVYFLGIGSTQYGESPGTQSAHDVLNFAGLYLANSGTEGGLFVTDSTGGSVYRNAFNPGANYSAGDIYGFALDLDSSTQTITFYRNGSNINPSSGAALDIAGACSILPVTVRLSIHEREAQCNFGGYTEFSISSAASDANGYGTFEYAPPSGYYAICTKNLEEYG